MTTWQNHLVTINACRDALDWCAKIPTFTEAWETCPDARWLLWLAFQVLPRRRAVGVLVEVVRATCAHIAPDEVTTEVLNLLAAWAAGDKDVDVEAVSKRAWRIWGPAAAAARAATAAAADAAAAAAWAAAAVARAARAAAADAAAAMADVVRAHLTATEVEAALMGGG